MSKVTSKLQVTIPKTLAQEYGILPGSDIEFVAAGEVIRVNIPGRPAEPGLLDREARLALFDEGSRRQRRRDDEVLRRLTEAPDDRGWRREELYDRGPPD